MNRFVLTLAVLALIVVVWLVAREEGAHDGDTVSDPQDKTSTPESARAGQQSSVDKSSGEFLDGAKSEKRREINLELRGRVVTLRGGEPIDGALVELRNRDADSFWSLDREYAKESNLVDQTHTDGGGRFRFEVRSLTKYRLRVRMTGFAEAEVTARAQELVTVRLPRGAALSGVAKDAGNPVPGVMIHLVDQESRRKIGESTTRIDGGFSFVHIPALPLVVRVHSPHHLPAEKIVTPDPMGENRCDFDLERGVRIRGKVVDADFGTPIAGASVALSRRFHRVVKSEEDGSFMIEGAHPARLAQLHVRAVGFAAGYHSVPSDVVDLDQPPAPIDIKLSRGGSAFGSVRTSTGTVPTQCYIALAATWMRGPGSESTDWIRARLDDDGRFVATGLRPDNHYWVYVRGRDLGTITYALPRKIYAGESIELPPIVLYSQAVVQGEVVDDKRRPIPGATVTIEGTNTDATKWVTTTQAPRRVTQFEMVQSPSTRAGHFRFSRLCPGEYTLSVSGLERFASVNRQIRIVTGQQIDFVRLVMQAHK